MKFEMHAIKSKGVWESAVPAPCKWRLWCSQRLDVPTSTSPTTLWWHSPVCPHRTILLHV